MTFLLVAAPIAGLALVIAIQALRKRRLSRHTLSVLVSLLLLLYLVATAALGLFWVAEMALPKFDLHYLVGYCLLLLAAAHVALQLRSLATFFRNHSPRFLLTSNGRQFRPGFRRALWIGMTAVVAMPICSLLLLQSAPAARIVQGRSPPDKARGAVGSAFDYWEAWIERGDKRQSVSEYLYEQASRPRARPLSRALHVLRLRRLPTTPTPPPQKAYPDRPSLPLSVPRRASGVTLRVALDQAWLDATTWLQKKQSSALQANSPSLVAVTREHMSDLLYHSYGVTRAQDQATGISLRAAASAGARYPIDVYVAVREVGGLDAGLYYYNPTDHTLVAISGSQALDQIARSVSRSDLVLGSPFSIVLGATFDRTVSRYGAHSYRYAALDAGHVASNVGLAGEALGLHCSQEALFDDRALAAAVGLPNESEGVLLVVSCDPTPDRSVGPGQGSLTLPPHRSLPFPADPDLIEVTRLSDLLTSWVLLPGTARQVAIPEVNDPAPSGATILPGAAGPDLDLFDVIRRRRSFRNFARRGVTQVALAGVLNDAYGLIPWARGRQLLELYVAVRAVEGLPAGIYRYRADQPAMQLVRSGDHSNAIEEASLSQQVLGRAAFVLMWAMRLDVAERLDGVRGFRHAHLAAGLGGQNAYLSAVGRHLGVCGVGAFEDTRLNAMIGGGSKRLVLFMVGVGHLN